MLPFKARRPRLTHKLVYSPRESCHSTDPNVQRKNLRYRNAYHRTSLPDAPPRRDDNESVRSRISTVCWFAHPPSYDNSTHWAPTLVIRTLWMPATKSWAPHSKQALGGEWSHPFCSRPWVWSSKGLKPVVMRWPERVLPWRPAHLPKNNNSLCHNCPTHLSHKCPTHLSHKCPIPISHHVLTSHFMYLWKFSHNEHQCASLCWCSPTRHTTSVIC